MIFNFQESVEALKEVGPEDSEILEILSNSVSSQLKGST